MNLTDTRWEFTYLGAAGRYEHDYFLLHNQDRLAIYVAHAEKYVYYPLEEQRSVASECESCREHTEKGVLVNAVSSDLLAHTEYNDLEDEVKEKSTLNVEGINIQTHMKSLVFDVSFGSGSSIVLCETCKTDIIESATDIINESAPDLAARLL